MFVVLRIKDPHAADTIPLADKPGHFVPGQDARAMLAGVQHIGGGQAEGVNGAVRHFHRADKRRVNRRFQPPRQRRVHGLSLNARRSAGGNKGVLKGEVIFGKSNKEAVGRLNAVAGDTLEDLVFSNTFACGFTVGNRIPRAAVQQAMVTPGCARGDIVALQQRDA